MWPVTCALLCLAALAVAYPLLLAPLAVFVVTLWVVDRWR
jgi:hypothetical protein